ncbi:Matrixin [Thalassobacillus cyri]|uniref:Matrixin n=1 Tax=Thalassobacillus cyri TaxID=571932 RepID=A0A1H4C1V9_9BACI|nr:matrixin family metalloprotease [Thalassobacillus cyri]SEA54435.1 Matrixin [Thalassobacillus cyri]
MNLSNLLRRKLALLLVLMTVFSFPGSTYAYEYFTSWYGNNYEFRSGISSGTYNISHAPKAYNYNGHTYDFYQVYNDALWKWNYKSNSNISTKDNSKTGKLNFYASNYGNNGYYGWVHHYNWDGSRAGSTCLACGPKTDWDYANSALNAYEFDEDGYTSYGYLINVAEHEIGHMLGLAHENDVPAVMNQHSWDWSIQKDDVNGVNNLY